MEEDGQPSGSGASQRRPAPVLPCLPCLLSVSVASCLAWLAFLCPPLPPRLPCPDCSPRVPQTQVKGSGPQRASTFPSLPFPSSPSPSFQIFSFACGATSAKPVSQSSSSQTSNQSTTSASSSPSAVISSSSQSSSGTVSSSSSVSTSPSTLITTSSSSAQSTSPTHPSSTATPTTVTPTSTPTSSSSSTSSSRSISTSTTPTTTLALPISTLSSTVFLQTTNSLGQVTSFAPLEFTSTFTSTLSNGGVVTFTEVVVNPTLIADSRASSTQFFRNKGVVVGVFLIVGLAAATIFLWIFFFVRRRRRRRRIEHDSAISQSLADAGYNRAPIDDEDFGPGLGMRQRFGSLSSHPSITTPITDEERATDAVPSVTLYDPYAGYGHPVTGSGYVQARSDSPSQNSRDRMADSTYSSGVSRRSGSMHIPQHSTGSGEALLAGMGIPPQAIPQPYTLSSPTVPLRNPKRKGGEGGPSSEGGDRPPPDYRAAGGRDQKTPTKV
ncbi:hypothetical protein F5148DRAFT_1190251 [Russula earlei]|uniref:Uncharacterized protein n=1 Tax=Russula earlei TaxID=71964 RepID=A0ACC0UCW5_9AGAM|nr:hypothetical protein F5148DRAFT_1190251 [Russula earlei]